MMRKSAGFVLLAAAFVPVGCGGPYVENLTSMAITPASLTMQRGQSQSFSASGTFSGALVHVPYIAVNWSFTGFTSMPKPVGVEIDQSGLVTCTTFTGTLPVYAVHPVNGLADAPYTLPASNDGTYLVASAQLTCN